MVELNEMYSHPNKGWEVLAELMPAQRVSQPQGQTFFKLCIFSAGLICAILSLPWVGGHLNCAGSCRFVTSPSAPHSSPQCPRVPRSCCHRLSCRSAAAGGLYRAGSCGTEAVCWVPMGRVFCKFVNCLMEKLRLAKKTNPHASFHWSKSNFVSLCGSIGDWARLRYITSNEVTHPKAVCPRAVRRDHFLLHYPKNWCPFLWFQFSKALPPPPPQLTLSMAELCSCWSPACLGSVPWRALPHLPPRSRRMSPGPGFCVTPYAGVIEADGLSQGSVVVPCLDPCTAKTRIASLGSLRNPRAAKGGRAISTVAGVRLIAHLHQVLLETFLISTLSDWDCRGNKSPMFWNVKVVVLILHSQAVTPGSCAAALPIN